MQSSKTSRFQSDSVKELSVSIDSDQKTSFFRIHLDLRKYSQKIIWNHFSKGQLYEPETSRFFLMVLKDGDCFIDVGAHIGCFSLLAAALVGASGKVISFEPEDLNYEQLRENIALNEFNHVRAYQLGLGSEKEEREFFVNLDNDGGHALWDVGLHPFNMKSRATPLIKKMELVSLDSIITKEQPKKLKLIKIDTEGSELKILQGATDTIIKNKVPYVICEVNRFGLQQMGTHEQDLRSFMEDIGYDTYLIVNGQELTFMRLSKDQFLKCEYVFNLLFIRRDFDLGGHCA